MRLSVLAAVAALSTAAVPAAAAETANDFQLYVLGDLNMNGQNFGNRVAVGGNATFTSTSIGGATAANPASLVVGGDLTYNNGGSIAGQALVGGGDYTPVYLPVVSGVTTLPVDFTAENLRLKNLSTSLSTKTATGASAIQWGGLQLTGSNADLNVFSITAANLSSINWTSSAITSGSQILINVSGTTVNLAGGLYFNNSSNILWNFYEATSITAGGVSLSGTVLAPFAAFQGNGGTIDGDLIAGRFNGAISLNGNGYGGNLLTPAAPVPPPLGNEPILGGGSVAVPEPATWALMILGFGAVGAMLRRRTRAALA